MGPIIPTVSAGFAHPLPTLTLLVISTLALPLTGVKVGPGSVTGDPTGEYVGSKVPGLVTEFGNEIVGGGHARPAITSVGIDPAPAPPVCHALREPWNGALFPHCPMAARGSVGIHPFSNPSL